MKEGRGMVRGANIGNIWKISILVHGPKNEKILQYLYFSVISKNIIWE